MTNWSNSIFWRIVLAAAPTNLASSHLYHRNRITGNTKVPITQYLEISKIKKLRKPDLRYIYLAIFAKSYSGVSPVEMFLMTRQG